MHAMCVAVRSSNLPKSADTLSSPFLLASSTVQHDVNIHIDDERDDFTAEKRSVPVMFVNDQRETSDLEFDGESQKSMSKVGAYLPGQ